MKLPQANTQKLLPTAGNTIKISVVDDVLATVTEVAKNGNRFKFTLNVDKSGKVQTMKWSEKFNCWQHKNMGLIITII